MEEKEAGPVSISPEWKAWAERYSKMDPEEREAALQSLTPEQRQHFEQLDHMAAFVNRKHSIRIGCGLALVPVAAILLLIAHHYLWPDPSATYRDRSNSDDAQTIEESLFHESARAFIISNIEPNKLRVEGREFRVKRNSVGEGCFVYDPRTRFDGVERLIVWWVPKEGTAYTLNSPSKMVTPGLKWPRDDGIDVRHDVPFVDDIVDYVFRGKPMRQPTPLPKPQVPPYTVKEYRIYRAVINTPMAIPEEEAIRNVAEQYSMSSDDVEKITQKVNEILGANQWFGAPEVEIRRASDWKGEKP